jgi:predicted transcriptional regulator
MYTSDIDAETALQHLGIPMEKLEKLVNELVEYGMLKTSENDVIELTEKAKNYIIEYMKKKIG